MSHVPWWNHRKGQAYRHTHTHTVCDCAKIPTQHPCPLVIFTYLYRYGHCQSLTFGHRFVNLYRTEKNTSSFPGFPPSKTSRREFNIFERFTFRFDLWPHLIFCDLRQPGRHVNNIFQAFPRQKSAWPLFMLQSLLNKKCFKNFILQSLLKNTNTGRQ